MKYNVILEYKYRIMELSAEGKVTTIREKKSQCFGSLVKSCLRAKGI